MSHQFLYHERQESALCGVHCLNNLLQGSYYNASDLAEIAHGIDENEQNLMMEAGFDGADYLKFMAEGSGNVADTGFFSVQVLGIALKNAFDLHLIPVQSEAGSSAMESPNNETGFICNLEEHWFAVREVYGEWFNFDSTAKTPSRLSQFYLSAFLDTLVKGGYSIFVVRGNFPSVVPQLSQPNWVPVPQQGASSTQLQSNEDDELQRAIAASLSSTSNIPANNDIISTYDDEDSEIARAIAASLVGTSETKQEENVHADLDVDEDLKAAILLSQEGNVSAKDAKNETLKRLISFQEENNGNLDSNCADILVEVPSLQQRTPCLVPVQTSLQELKILVQHKLKMPEDNKEYLFMTTMPRQQVSDLSRTIKELNWKDNIIFTGMQGLRLYRSFLRLIPHSYPANQEVRVFVEAKVKTKFKENIHETDQEKCNQLYKSGLDQLKLILLSIPRSERPNITIPTYFPHTNQSEVPAQQLEIPAVNDHARSKKVLEVKQLNDETNQSEPKQPAANTKKMETRDSNQKLHLNTCSLEPGESTNIATTGVQTKLAHVRQLNKQYIDNLVDNYIKNLKQ